MKRVMVIALALVTARGADADDLTHEYVVKPGDTCVSIAVRELGDAARCTAIHRLNPFLGKSPDNLKAGAILWLPTAACPPSDSTLTAMRGSVQVRKPKSREWEPIELGMDLFRAWRVRAQDGSSAEVALRDTSRLFMRKNTRVIIYGAAGSRATLNANAELESGALESRVGTRSGRRVVIHTPSAEVSLGNGLVVVDPVTATDTIVSNHDSAPATVRALDAGRKPRGAAIRVAAGMGCKIKSGQLASPPRALPPAPIWQSSTRFVDLAGGGATVSAQWSPVAGAVRYDVAIRTAAGEDVLATEVMAPASSIELHRFHPGRYIATVATIDADGFEGTPATALAFDVVPIAIIPPGSTEPLVVTPLNEQPPGPYTTTPPASVAHGSRIVAGDGFTCAAGAEFSSDLALIEPIREITCRDPDGRLLPPVPLTVAAIYLSVADGDSPTVSLHRPTSLHLHIRSAGPFGSELFVRGTELDILAATRTADGFDLVVRPPATAIGIGMGRISLVTAAGLQVASIDLISDLLYNLPEFSWITDLPQFPARRYPGPLELGLFGGYWIVPGQPALGAPVDDAHAVSDGPATGLRAALWIDDGVGVDLEAMVAFTSQAEGSATARVAGWRGHLFVGTQRSRLGVRVLVGGGTNTLDSRTRGALEVGAAAILRVADAWLLRLDARDDFLLTRSNEATHIPAFYLGLSRAFLR